MRDQGSQPRRSTSSRTAEDREARAREKRPTGSSSSTSPPERTNSLWPRLENTPFQLPAFLTQRPAASTARLPECYNREFTTEWDPYDAFFYNGLLGVKFEPTRLICREFCEHVKWFDALKQLSRDLGLGTMPFKFYKLYPDLARQFLASCRVVYVDPVHPTAHGGSLMFKLDGVRYSVTFREICAIFGFDAEGEELQIPSLPGVYHDLWTAITNTTQYVPATALHSDIRHPVLRMFLRLLSNTLLCKMEPGKMRKNELVLLHYTIGRHFAYAQELDVHHTINFGAVFAHYLEELKEKGLSGTGKIETVGSLLTPFFTKVGISLQSRETVSTRSVIGEKSLKKGLFIRGDWGSYQYGFKDVDQSMRYLPLPSDLCRIDSEEALCFRPLVGDLHGRTHSDRRIRGTSSQTAAPRASASSSSGLPPFTLPPAGSYEDDPFRSWLTRTLGSIWDHLRCTRASDVETPIPPPSPPRFTQDDAEAGAARARRRHSRSRSHSPHD